MGKLFKTLEKLSSLDIAEEAEKGSCDYRITRSDNIHGMQSSKQGDLITMGVATGAIRKLSGLLGEPTHVAMLFMVRFDEYMRVNKELEVTSDSDLVQISQNEYDLLMEKASNWDKLDAKIAEFYDEDHVESDADLDVIGEAAAQAFGYL